MCYTYKLGKRNLCSTLSRNLLGQAPRLTGKHALVCAVGDGEDVRRHLVAPLVDVEADGRLGVDREAAVRVHRHAEQARVRLNRSTKKCTMW